MFFTLLSLFTACNGTSTAATWVQSNVVEPSTEFIDSIFDTGLSDPGADGTTTSGTSTTVTNPGGVIASIPLPTLKTESFLTYQSDAAGANPIVGQAGAVVNFDNGDQLAVSASSFTMTNACEETKIANSRTSATSTLARLQHLLDFIPDAKAAEADTTSTCGDTFDTCPINTDGSFECFVTPGASTETFHFAIVDSECNIKSAEVYEDAVQKNMLYLKNSPSDVVVAGDGFVSLTPSNQKAQRITRNEDDDLQVDNYEAITASGSKLAYAGTDSLVGVLSEGTGVQLLSLAEDGSITDSGETSTIEGATAYTQLKALSGSMYFGAEQASSTTAYLGLATLEELIDPRFSTPYIWIVKPDDGGDTDPNNTSAVIHHTKTIAFDQVDIGGIKWTVVAFEDDGGNVRTRVMETTGATPEQRFDGTIWKTTTDVDIKDLVAYYNDGTDNIYYAMLDNKNGKIWPARFDKGGSTPTRYSSDDKAISVGTDPVAMSYSATSGNLYVLNKGGKSISVVKMATTETDTSAVTSTIDLSSFVSGKTIDYVPSSLVLSGDSLLIGDETTKAVMVVDVSEQE